MTMNFRQALLREIAARGTSLKRVCEESGVSYEQMKKLSQRPDATTNVDDAVKLAAALGLTVNELLQDDLASDRIEQARLWSRLTEPERQMLQRIAAATPAPPPAED
jgi:hypothetical protein